MLSDTVPDMNNIYWNRLAACLKQHHLPCKDLNIVLGFTYGMEMVSVLFIDVALMNLCTHRGRNDCEEKKGPLNQEDSH